MNAADITEACNRLDRFMEKRALPQLARPEVPWQERQAGLDELAALLGLENRDCFKVLAERLEPYSVEPKGEIPESERGLPRLQVLPLAAFFLGLLARRVEDERTGQT
jgi:hypothetical protein